MKKVFIILIASISLLACAKKEEKIQEETTKVEIVFVNKISEETKLHEENVKISSMLDEDLKMQLCEVAWSKKECEKISLDDIIITQNIDDYILTTYEVVEVDDNLFIYDLNFKKDETFYN